MRDQNSKGNGAATRMANEKLKAKRARCWRNGQERKASNVEENERRAAVNRERGITTHELKRQERLERRARAREEAAA